MSVFSLQLLNGAEPNLERYFPLTRGPAVLILYRNIPFMSSCKYHWFYRSSFTGPIHAFHAFAYLLFSYQLPDGRKCCLTISNLKILSEKRWNAHQPLGRHPFNISEIIKASLPIGAENRNLDHRYSVSDDLTQGKDKSFCGIAIFRSGSHGPRRFVYSAYVFDALWRQWESDKRERMEFL